MAKTKQKFTRKIWQYDIGTVLKVTLNGTYYLHSEDSYTGSEAELSRSPCSVKSDWYGVSVIYGKYAGARPDTLKLKLEMLSGLDGGKQVLAVPLSMIKDISDRLKE